ncbi:MAG: hypothetical protein RBT74_02150 [Tenuifilaceae bacterium]|jgi:myosin heavy subunit|nr:hypothetical protein [Tenuifilaceae bacterium]
METTARSKVVIDNQQAEQALNELTQEAKKYKQAMSDAIKANDLGAHKKAEQQWKSTNKAIKNARVELQSVDEVMKNLSGASMKQLQVAKRSLTAELNKMTRGTDDYIRKSKQLQDVNSEIKKVRGEMYGVSGASEGMFGKLRSGFMWMAGAIGGSMALWRGFTSIMKSTQTGADSLERTMQGLKGAVTALQQSISQGDWKNLISNMRNGYLAAASYADALDELADRTRAVDVRTAEQKAEMEELRNIMASTETETIEAREKAQERYMQLNKEILEATKQNAHLRIKAEKDNLKKQHGVNDEQVELMIDFVRHYDELSDKELAAIMKLQTAESDYQATRQAFINSHERYQKVGDDLIRIRGTEADLTDKQREKLVELKKQHESERNLLNDKAKAYLEITKELDNFSDDYRDNVAQALKSVADADAQFENLQRNAVRRREALEREKKQREKDAQNAEIEALEQQHQKVLLEIDRQYVEEHQSSTLHKQQTEAAEWAFLEARIAMYKKFGMDSTALENDRVKQQIKALETFRAEQLVVSQELINKNIEDTDAAILAEMELYSKGVEEKRKANEVKQKLDEEALANHLQTMAEYKQITDTLGASIGNLLGQMATDAEMTAADVARQLILIALDSFQAFARMAIAKIWAGSLSSVESIATLGAAGVAKAVALSALVEAAFAGVKAAVSNVGQRYAGKYDVIGADDGQLYRNIPYSGTMKTGIYNRPTLVAERGSELIVDHGTLNNIRVNFPDVLPKIQASMVPQRAAGNVSEATSKGVNTYIDGDMRAAFELFLDSVRLFHHDVKSGIPAKLSYKELSREQSKNAGITNVASK